MRGVAPASASPVSNSSGRKLTLHGPSERHRTHQRLALELYEHSIGAAASQSQPVARYCYGGPVPFGLGLGIVHQLERLAWLQPPPDPREQQRRERAQEHHELRKLQRNFSAPLDHLDADTQARVREGRLRRLLSKFWGLMHEKDRPWHYDTIVHLCCRLPKPARQLYRRLKASTLQRILAKRAQVEKGLLECLPALEKEVRCLNKWQYQVLEHGRTISQQELEQSLDNLRQLQNQLAVNEASLQSQRKQAWQLGDKDYTQEYGSQLQDLLQQCRRLCREMQRNHHPYVKQISSMNSKREMLSVSSVSMFAPGRAGRREQVSEQERLLAISRIGPLPPQLMLPSHALIRWRYPPWDSLQG